MVILGEQLVAFANVDLRRHGQGERWVQELNREEAVLEARQVGHPGIGGVDVDGDNPVLPHVHEHRPARGLRLQKAHQTGVVEVVLQAVHDAREAALELEGGLAGLDVDGVQIVPLWLQAEIGVPSLLPDESLLADNDDVVENVPPGVVRAVRGQRLVLVLHEDPPEVRRPAAERGVECRAAIENANFPRRFVEVPSQVVRAPAPRAADGGDQVLQRPARVPLSARLDAQVRRGVLVLHG
mmetsp:Transcript_61379/g.187469  ORF Transcript_61379/g.187469 Transcript_61379/m.187469 type:complete len:240 (+) Transcript_61379:3355-4074(+)